MWVGSFSWEAVAGSRVKEWTREGGQLLEGATGGTRGSILLETLRGKHGACSDLPTEGCEYRSWGTYPSGTPSLVETHETVTRKLQVASKEGRGNMDRTALATRCMTRSECKQWERLLMVLNPTEDCTESMCTHR